MRKQKLVLRPLAGPIALALLAVLALPVAVLANTSDAIAQTGGMTATLPMLGSSLTVEVTLDASGNLSKVNLDPVGTYSASKPSAHAVSFDSGDGTTKVMIRAGGDKLAVKATAGTLDALVGSGTWSADVFGTGEKTKVGYTIGNDGGKPTLTIDSVDAPAGITVVQGTPTSTSKEHESKVLESGASARVAFSSNGYTRTLRISVSVGSSQRASLQITLSGKDRQKLTGALADLVGSHTWSGMACDGTAVGLTYDVLADGTVAYGSATGATATVKTGGHGFSARFDGTRVKVKVSLRQAADGTYALTASASKGWCLHQGVPLPSVNTPVKPGAERAAQHNGDRKHGGEHSEHHGSQSAGTSHSAVTAHTARFSTAAATGHAGRNGSSGRNSTHGGHTSHGGGTH